jgi:hypothetical protein
MSGITSCAAWSTHNFPDRILSVLGVGKQSEQYKRVKAVLDQLMPKI